MSKRSRAFYKWNVLVHEHQKNYGEALTKLDQSGLDSLMTACKETRALIGHQPNLSSEIQMGHFRRLGHVITVVEKVAETNQLVMPKQKPEML